MGTLRIAVDHHEDGGEAVRRRKAGDEIKRQVLPQARGNWQRLEQTSGFTGLIFNLLANPALRNEAVDVTVHVIPVERVTEAAQRLLFTHVSTQWGGVEFFKEHGDERVVRGQPQLAAKGDAAGIDGIVRVGLGLLVECGK